MNLNFESPSVPVLSIFCTLVFYFSDPKFSYLKIGYTACSSKDCRGIQKDDNIGGTLALHIVSGSCHMERLICFITFIVYYNDGCVAPIQTQGAWKGLLVFSKFDILEIVLLEFFDFFSHEYFYRYIFLEKKFLDFYTLSRSKN